jgi:hypothetical protein
VHESRETDRDLPADLPGSERIRSAAPHLGDHTVHDLDAQAAGVRTVERANARERLHCSHRSVLLQEKIPARLC